MARSAAELTGEEDLVRVYLQEIGRHSLLTPDEEISLAKAIEAGVEAENRLARTNGSTSQKRRFELERLIADGESARKRFIEANLRLVVSNARRYQGFGLPLLDLIQDGNIGLLRAVEKFDWRRGFKFSTYATWWVRQGITRGLADRARLIRLPVHVAEIVHRLRRVEAELLLDLGREPEEEELAIAVGIDIEQLRACRQQSLDTVSLSAPVGDSGDHELGELIEDLNAEQPMEEAVRTRTAQELRGVLGTLSTREQRILELRFGFVDGREKTLDQIGKEFNLTRERIRQIEAKALAKLRHPARWTELDAFQD
jgi:RNA polymerase primary sigma factor